MEIKASIGAVSSLGFDDTFLRSGAAAVVSETGVKRRSTLDADTVRVTPWLAIPAKRIQAFA
jgi:hypothetical protein